jgi:hypothetical protein
MNACMTGVIDYAVPGPITDLGSVCRSALDPVSTDPIEICRPVNSLLIRPRHAERLDLPAERFAEIQIRPISRLIELLLALDPAPMSLPRERALRVVGTCRHFAVMACALLRFRGFAARARCGFATYFQPGQGLDHWITEYWNDRDSRWVRVDIEILGEPSEVEPADLRPGEFLTGGEAWAAYRSGQIEAERFGVEGTDDHWGPSEIRANAVKDLAALNKVEVLPWEQWGQIKASYRGETGADYDELIDRLAAVCASDDAGAIADLYAHDQLRVPAELINLTSGPAPDALAWPKKRQDSDA